MTNPRRTSGSHPGGVVSSDALVRPYAVTGGRTRPRMDIALEALVTTHHAPWQVANASSDWQRVVSLCQKVQSLAEIAAHLKLPLGVARVIVGDMAAAGLVEVHATENFDDQINTYLLERVLSGLRKL